MDFPNDVLNDSVADFEQQNEEVTNVMKVEWNERVETDLKLYLERHGDMIQGIKI